MRHASAVARAGAALVAAVVLGAACGPPAGDAGRGDSLPADTTSPVDAAADTVTVDDTTAATRRAAAGARDDTSPREEEDTMPSDTSGPGAPVEEVLDRHREAWMARPEVTGTGVGLCDGRPCLVVYLLRRTEEIEAFLPDTVEGHPVRLEVTGRVEPRDGGGGGSGAEGG